MASLFEKGEAAVPASCDPEQHDGNKANRPGLSVAIPLISTEGSPGGYEVHDSATVGTAAALRFLASTPRRNVEGLRVVLAAEEGSSALEALRRQKQDLATLEPRLIVKACALPDVARAGAPCSYIVNPCNWQLVGRGGRTNVLVNKAAGPCLETASLEEKRKRAGTRVRVADPIPIKLPPESPLREEGQVETVIQVLGPNIDPRFPDCLKSQPVEARRLLCRAYDNALECFWDLASTAVDTGKIPEKGSENVAVDVSKVGGLPGVGKSSAPAASGGCKRSADGSQRRVSNAKPSGYREGPPVPVLSGAGGGHWKTALFKYLQEPRALSIQREVFYEDEQCVIVYDGYPKAKYHLLLLPKKGVINDARQPNQLRGNHLQALRRLHSVAKSVACSLSASGAGFVRYGYHAIPSLEPLHVHIISQDFDSPCMKKKSHWNGFTTGFFLECSWVEERLADRGRLSLDLSRYRDLEKQPLRCFRCGAAVPTMPTLKEHNHACQAPVPQLLEQP